MKNNEVIRIAVAESSIVIRTGMTQALKRLPNLKIQPVELASMDALHDCLHTQPPSILLVNPLFGEYFDVAHFRSDPHSKGIHLAALVSALTDASTLARYDAVISIFDDLDAIHTKISKLQHIEPNNPDENTESLSQREKEIIVCVVKGLTNKEIAEQLFLSIHTVITHRRNITRKLQIHSASGLTIYAIVNKLVELGEIKNI